MTILMSDLKIINKIKKDKRIRIIINKNIRQVNRGKKGIKNSKENLYFIDGDDLWKKIN